MASTEITFNVEFRYRLWWRLLKHMPKFIQRLILKRFATVSVGDIYLDGKFEETIKVDIEWQAITK